MSSEHRPTLPEVYQSINTPAVGKKSGMWRKLFAFSGPGYLVAVGYMDPGNWATSIAAGSEFGYLLLSIVLITSIMAVLFQSLATKLGIATGKDLAQLCKEQYPKQVGYALWFLTELMIIATDLAELIGSAIALQLLFGMPLLYGILLTALDVLIILMMQNKGFRYIETFVVSLILIIGGAFLYELLLSSPDFIAIGKNLVPTDATIISNTTALYLAVGILGATIMPHNIFLHSSIVQTRKYQKSHAGKLQAIRYATWDVIIALTFAFFINAAILILAASTFHKAGMYNIATIEDAYQMLTPLLGTTAASIVFAVALLASGQNSTLTGTLTGQIIMEGFLNIKLKPWLRRLITRLLAIIPAAAVVILMGERKGIDLLILSQVLLSLHLPFTLYPLMRFTSNKKIMGHFKNSITIKILGWGASGLIVVLNLWMLIYLFYE